MRILFFGDSITQGFWDTEGGWTQRLRRHYDEQAIAKLDTDDEYMPEFFNLGISGETTRDLLARVEQETKTRKFTGGVPQDPIIAVIAIGTNDDAFEHGKQWIPPDEFRANLVKIVEKLQPLVAAIILAGNAACDEHKTMPVSWGAYYYSNAELQRSETTVGDVARHLGLPFVSIFERFKAELDAGKDLLADGLHPDNAGHQLIADLVLPALEKVINDVRS